MKILLSTLFFTLISLATCRPHKLPVVAEDMSLTLKDLPDLSQRDVENSILGPAVPFRVGDSHTDVTLNESSSIVTLMY